MLAEILLPIIVGAVILACLSVPLYIIVFLATFYLQIFVNDVPLAAIYQGAVESLSKISLMAVPYFVFAGALIQHSSLGQRLIVVFAVTLRNVRAGLALACLLSFGFFGAISGSPPATVAALGKLIYKPLEKAHGEKTALGLMTSSGTLSSIIPPSIPMILFCVATESNVAKLFEAGIIPGLLTILVIGLYLFIKGGRSSAEVITEEGVELPSLGKALYQGIPVIVLPVLILGSIYAGVCTPTEAGALAAFYSFVVPLFILRDVKFKAMPGILVDSIKVTAQVFILVTATIAFAQAITMAQLPRMLTDALSGMGWVEFLIFLNIVLLIAGCFFDPGSAILILAPLLLPTCRALGIDPIHMGIIFTFNLSIGFFTPPIGLSIFVVQSVLKKPAGLIIRSVIPYLFLYLFVMALVTYIPELSLSFSRLIH